MRSPAFSVWPLAASEKIPVQRVPELGHAGGKIRRRTEEALEGAYFASRSRASAKSVRIRPNGARQATIGYGSVLSSMSRRVSATEFKLF